MLQDKVALMPNKPGVYLLKDSWGEVIYIGKAQQLKKRLSSYLQVNGPKDRRTTLLLKELVDFDYLITHNELEALILEANLIQKYHPRYNIRLKDDKSYPYIKVTVNETYPRIIKTRELKRDEALYFGPYTRVKTVEQTLDLLQELFGLRSCVGNVKVKRRPCLNYHLKRCMAPCKGELSLKEYQHVVQDVILFLEGRQGDLKIQLQRRMRCLSKEQKYEQAAVLRDRLQALTELRRTQKVFFPEFVEQDVVGLVMEETFSSIQVLIIRQGRLQGEEHFILENRCEEDTATVISAFIRQYYCTTPYIPGEILVSDPPQETDLLEEWLTQRSTSPVHITVPKRGQKLRLINLAQENAQQSLREREKLPDKTSSNVEGLEELQRSLQLSSYPERIIGFDISNIQGVDAVGSCVVFVGGEPYKEDYRRFRIREVEGSNDYAMLQEVVRRYFSSLGEEEYPELVLVDGGKGQLHAVAEVFLEVGIHVQLMSLAKREEEIYLLGQDAPYILPGHSSALQLLQQVRDEAHRFAVNYHRQLRSRRLTHSMLDEIPGVGKKRREALLKHFRSLDAIRRATQEELEDVVGIDKKMAQRIRKFLEERTRPF